MDNEGMTTEKLIEMPAQESKRRQLRIYDELEDFLDEGNITVTSSTLGN